MPGIIAGIDTGGTSASGFFAWGKRIETVRTDATSPADAVISCLRKGAEAFHCGDLQAFLREVEVLRFSPTVSDILLPGLGDRVGILITKGYEDSLYGRDEKTRLPQSLLAGHLVEGIEEEVRPEGQVVRTPDETRVVESVRRLWEFGARVIIVSFHNAHINADNEKRAKRIIDTYFPRSYLGSLPVILASQICSHPDEAGRTNLAVLNGFMQRKVSADLYHAEDSLRKLGYSKPLFILDRYGGCSQVAKMKPVDMVGSGAIAGYTGAMYWAKVYGLPNVVTLDMGGTSIDIGVLADSRATHQERQLLGIHVATPVLGLTSVPMGECSVTRANTAAKTVDIVPPGSSPAGQDATVMDADVVLKRVRPEPPPGGRAELSMDRAREAIRRAVAEPLGLNIEEAALQVIEKFTDLSAQAARNAMHRPGGSTSGYVLFAYGGWGPVHCCEVAERLAISRIYTFPFASAFRAFGTSVADFTRTYVSYAGLNLLREGNVVLDIEAFNRVLKAQQQSAFRDMLGESVSKEVVEWQLELEIAEGEGDLRILVTSPKLALDSDADGEAILQSYRAERARSGLSGSSGREARIEALHLKSHCPLPRCDFPVYFDGTSPDHALKGKRAVPGRGWSPDTTVYAGELLKSGNIVTGPAILESSDAPCLIPAGWRLTVDQYLNRIIERI